MKPSNDRFAGQVAVVTGARSGIGRAAAARLAQEGAAVLGCGRGPRPPDLADGVAWQTADVSAPDDVRTLRLEAGKLPGRIAVLVNNAGIQINGPSPTRRMLTGIC